MRYYILRSSDCIVALHLDKEIIRALFFEWHATRQPLTLWTLDVAESGEAQGEKLLLSC